MPSPQSRRHVRRVRKYPAASQSHLNVLPAFRRVLRAMNSRPSEMVFTRELLAALAVIPRPKLPENERIRSFRR